MLSISPTEEVEDRNKINAICDAFEQTEVAKEIDRESNIMGSTERLAYRKASHQKIAYNATWWTQFKAVLWRSWLIVKKDPKLIRTRLSQTIVSDFVIVFNERFLMVLQKIPFQFVALFIGFIFFNQNLDQDGVMNINGAIFLFVTSMTFQNVFTVIHVSFSMNILKD